MIGSYVDLGNPVSDHPLNQGLVGWWMPLPNNSGGLKLFDLRGRANGTRSGATLPTWTTGRYGQMAITVSGASNEKVDCGTAGWSALTDSITLELSCRFLQSEVNRFYFGRPYTGGSNQPFGMLNIAETSQRIGFGFYDGTWHLAADASAIVLNQDYHIVGTYDRVNLKVYVNGVLVGTTAETAAMPSGTTPVLFGSGWIAGQTMIHYSGSIRNRAVSASEVWRLYEQTKRGHPDTLRRWSRKAWLFSAAPATGNRRRRVICGS